MVACRRLPPEAGKFPAFGFTQPAVLFTPPVFSGTLSGVFVELCCK
jgi:hypothetical protein